VDGLNDHRATEPTSVQATIAPDLPAFLRDCRDAIAATVTLAVRGKLTRVAGLVLEASGLRLAVGSCCQVLLPNGNSVEAEVVGFSEDRLFLMPINDVYGLTPGALVAALEPAVERPELVVPPRPRRRGYDTTQRMPVGAPPSSFSSRRRSRQARAGRRRTAGARARQRRQAA
jgi:flagellum-specific ATP synthase